ncbi:hypothetical protein AAVH_09826 [Aphelenchoides avenae]|nr:hypothetical protein AAVH_09826 [Aphelenchus avenae]
MFACKTALGLEHLTFMDAQLKNMKAAIGTFPGGPELAAGFVPTFPPGSVSNGCPVYELQIIDAAYRTVSKQSVNEYNRLDDELKKETFNLLDKVAELFGNVPRYRSELPSNSFVGTHDSLKLLWSLCGNLQLKKTADCIRDLYQDNEIQLHRKDLACFGTRLSYAAATMLFNETKIARLSKELEESNAKIRALKEEADDTHERIKAFAAQLDRALGIKPLKGRKVKQDQLMRLEAAMANVQERLRNSQANQCTSKNGTDAVHSKSDDAAKQVQELERSLKALEDVNRKLVDDYECAREDRKRDKEKIEQLSKQLEKVRAERDEEKNKSKKGKKHAKG